MSYSGADLGYGLATVALGAFLSGLAVGDAVALVRGRAWYLGLAAAALILVLAGHYLLAYHITVAPGFGGPEPGFFTVLASGVVGLIVTWRLARSTAVVHAS